MYDCMSVIYLLTHKDGEDINLDFGTTFYTLDAKL